MAGANVDTLDHTGHGAGDGNAADIGNDGRGSGDALQRGGRALAVAGESSALISMIERAARDPNVDIDKMERLFSMHERVTAKASEAAFNAAMARAQAELKPVARKLDNKQTNSKYADLSAISLAADPIIHKHGFGVICSEFQSPREHHVGVRLEVTHEAGHSKSYEFNIPMDGTGIKGVVNKTATHAYGSTITYGRRYAKCSVFDIATTGDTDGNMPNNMITPDQAEELAKLISSVGADLDWILGHHKVESLSDMTGKDYSIAKAGLLTRQRELAKEEKQ